MRMYKKLITLILVLTMVLSQGVLTPLAAEQSIYSEEIEVIKALGIMVGDENGDFGSQNNLTRAEFANVLTVLLQINDSDTAKENAWYFKAGETWKNQVLDGEKVQRFTDVPADHWAYGVIEQVTSLGYMIGTSNTEFSPEENVTINQVNKVLVKMLGYEVFAERNGGYPAGYNYTASSIKLLKGINHYGETPILRGELAKMLVNMFDVEMIEIGNVTDSGTATYQQSDKTFLEDSLKIFTEEGELTDTSVTGLYGESGVSEGEVIIGGVVYKVAEGVEYINSFLGKIIEIYYVKDTNGRNIVLYATLSDDTDEFVVDIKDFISLSKGELKYTDEDEDVETLDLVSIPVTIFNGTAVDTISTEHIKDFYNGTITAINSDNKGEYDMLVIEAYRTMFVKNFADGKIVNGLLVQGKDKDAVLNLDKEDNKDTVITYYKDNLPASALDIARNSVIDVAVSKGEIKVIITKETKNITVMAISDDADGYFIYDAEGNAYRVADDYLDATKTEEKEDKEKEETTAVKLPLIGANCTLHFNSFGEVAYAEVSTAEYPNTGIIINAAEDGRGIIKGVKVKIFSNTGRFTEYNLAEKVSFTDSENNENRYKSTDKKVLSILSGLKNKLVTFKYDEDKKITAIKEPMKLEDRQGREKGRLGVIYEAKGEATYRDNNIGLSAYITGDTTIFSVSSDMGISEEEKYHIYTKKELDTLGETKFASVAYNTDKNSPDADVLVATDIPLTSYKLSGTNTPLYLVDKVMQSVNADGEQTVMLEGTYLSGGQSPAGVTKKYVSATGAFSNMRALVESDNEKYTVQKGDIISCLEVNGDVKFAALVYRRTHNYQTNSRYEGGALVGVNSGVYNNANNSNPYNPANGSAIDVNGYKIFLQSFGSGNLNPYSWRICDMFVISANEKYITLTTQDLSAPGSIPEYNNPAYTVISIPVPTNITRQIKKGDNYSSGPIYFTAIKTYETSLNDCSRAIVVTHVQRPYKLVILDEE